MHALSGRGAAREEQIRLSMANVKLNDSAIPCKALDLLGPYGALSAQTPPAVSLGLTDVLVRCGLCPAAGLGLPAWATALDWDDPGIQAVLSSLGK